MPHVDKEVVSIAVQYIKQSVEEISNRHAQGQDGELVFPE